MKIDRALPEVQRVLLSLVRRMELGSEDGWVEIGDLADNAPDRVSTYGRDHRHRTLDALLQRGLVGWSPDSNLYVRTTEKGRAELGDETGGTINLQHQRQELDRLAQEMAEDGRSIKAALVCSTPGHDARSCDDCKARRAQIRKVMRG